MSKTENTAPATPSAAAEVSEGAVQNTYNATLAMSVRQYRTKEFEAASDEAARCYVENDIDWGSVTPDFMLGECDHEDRVIMIDCVKEGGVSRHRAVDEDITFKEDEPYSSNAVRIVKQLADLRLEDAGSNENLRSIALAAQQLCGRDAEGEGA